ncbi:MAG: hypothetical protein AMJ92_07295 [candidate division Zixibacteria bacterium SM23_81]|nr:MAG: hypothetical protein AMJ92_07295 [candidate division Zixibacteria bacterium SM23_81]
MPVCQVTVVPLGTGTPSLSAYVADCQRVLARYADLSFQLTPMATVIEGDLNRILEVVKEMHEVPFRRGVHRVSTTLVIDDRRDKPLTMQGKVDSVEEKLAGKE